MQSAGVCHIRKNDEENKKKDPYLAHVIPETHQIQPLLNHHTNVRHLILNNCPLEILTSVAWLAATFHDCGKYGPEFQAYMEEVLEKAGEEVKRNVDHSTAGGRLITSLAPGMLASKIISTAIYSHHGLADCINMESGRSLEEERNEKKIDYDTITERFFQYTDIDVIQEHIDRAKADSLKIMDSIAEMINRDKPSVYGSGNFYLGMYERLLVSLLIDSDWSDTASFFEQKGLPRRLSKEETQHIWEQSIAYFEDYLSTLTARDEKKKSPLNVIRQEISDICLKAAEQPDKLYCLTVPTGAGKTFSGLRFALHHAQKYEKQHIMYVAPFNSILEQNAEEIRNAVGNNEFVLEHHCNIVKESADEEEKYRRLTETWDCPIIVTTAVQVLNTLFSGRKRDIRRMHSLCNSIIIFDEVQAFPINCTELFNLAVNFLSAFCNTTVVLCSATQPTLAKLPKNCMFDADHMVRNVDRYSEEFKRTKIQDMTDLVSGGMSVNDLKNFIDEIFPDEESILVIVNTKACAKALYELLEGCYNDTCILYHLSTNMCPKNRQEQLDEIKQSLDRTKRVICVSTQLVEAGVDFSFRCVIRSMAGLDNIIQAAGRCNRNKKNPDAGPVYIVRMSPEAEHLSGLPDIKAAQEAMETVLHQYRTCPESLDGKLDSQKAVAFYYRQFYLKMVNIKTNYPASYRNTPCNLVDLLSDNKLGKSQYTNVHGHRAKNVLNQAFKTAGELFRVIPDDEGVKVVVEYDEETKKLLNELDNPYLGLKEQKEILRKLQVYTVGISEYRKEKLGRAVTSVCQGNVLVLSENYYSKKTGVSDIPKMNDLFS